MSHQTPSIGRIVIFRSRTGAYDCPAIITATEDTLNPAGVAAYEASVAARAEHLASYPSKDDVLPPLRGVPPLTGPDHVHLTVFTPGIPGQRGDADDFLTQPSTGIIGENVAGCYQEYDVVPDRVRDASVPAGTWRWPTRV